MLLMKIYLIFCCSYTVVVAALAGGTEEFSVLPGIKIKPGLSSFSNNVGGLYEYIRPLLAAAALDVPPECVSTPELHIRGTAGMRLLPEEVQAVIWDNLFEQILLKEKHHFILRRSNFGTISGMLFLK